MSSDKPTPEDEESPQKRQRVGLYDRLSELSFINYDNPKLVGYLTEKGLNGLAGEATSGEMSGKGFLANITDLDERHAAEMGQLAELANSDPMLKPNPVHPKKTFSTNTTLLSKTSHFYVQRLFKVDLSQEIKSGGFLLLHGPRSSGKSTLMFQLITGLPSTKFVYGKLELSAANVTIENMWNQAMASLADNSSNASEEVRHAAQQYLDGQTKYQGSPLMHLFRQPYGEKKLVLFWDEFDNAYTPERKREVSEALRSVQNLVASESLPSFQAVVLFGSYNSNLVTSLGGGSNFVPTKTFTHENLDFTLEETKNLFSQYEREYGVKVARNVVADIHQITGGHTGLTNLCGHFIQQAAGNFDQARCNTSFPALLRDIARRQIYVNMMESIKIVEEPEATMELLRRLCYGEGEPLGSTSPFKNLQHLGFASEKKINKDFHFIIKSDLIRRFSLVHVVHDQPAFSDIPLIEDKDSVDLPALLIASIRHFQPKVIKGAFATAKKKIYNSHHSGPRESVYQFQFYAVLLTALSAPWSFEFEASLPGKPKSKIDFHLVHEDGLAVGIEFIASEGQGEIAKHANRDYQHALKLDQYVVVSFTPEAPKEGGFSPYFSPGVDKDNNECQIPVYHILKIRNKYCINAIFFLPSSA